MRVATLQTLARAAALGCAIALAAILLTACASGTEPRPTGHVSELRKKYPEQIDLARARESCLTKKGWGVTLSSDGAIVIDLANGQEAEYARADLECLKEIGIDPDAPTPEWVIEEAFAYHRAGAQCLRKLGFTIGAAPSYQTFKDTYETHAWWPWDEVPELDQPVAEKKCPTPPPTY